MSDQKSWEASLVKKFSSSNHFKLLNQLRTEVKKYPLNRKKNQSLNLISDSNIDSRSKSTPSKSQDIDFSKSSNSYNENITNESKVNFNNSKNFSIYNTQINDINKVKNSNSDSNKPKSQEESESLSFKDRLNKIDLK